MCIISKIVSIFMTIVTFIGSIFGIETIRTNNYVYKDLCYGSHERQTLDLYIPKGKDEVGLVLYIHGGAWIAGDKDGYESTLEYVADEMGYACAAVNYRYLSEDIDLNDIMDDIQLAVEKIKETADKKDVEINKMLLTGGSAGGHLSLLYAYSRDEVSAIKPAAVVSDCGPTDLSDVNYFYGTGNGNGLGDFDYVAKLLSWACGQSFTFETRHEAEAALKKVSPLYYVDENTVPTVINHGMFDDIVPYSNALALDAKLTQYGIPHHFNSYPNSGHGLNNDAENMAIASELFNQYVEAYLN